MTFLFPKADLAASNARYKQAQAAKAPPAPPPPLSPSPAPDYVYRERSTRQWNARMNQSLRSAFGVVVEPDPEIENGDEDDSGEPKSKVGPNTPCLCGHKRSDHHTSPEPHTIDGDHAYYCVTTHCAAMKLKDGRHVDCDCEHFRAQETDVPKLTRPRVGSYDRCANPACGHWKIDHCTKSKPGKALRLKPGESAYKILLKADGTAYPCKHFLLDDPACQCTSTSCAATADGVNFCDCEKFVNPLLVRKTRVATKKRAPSSPVATSLAGAPTDSTPENALAGEPVKLRRTREKKTGFVTGQQEIFPPAVEVRP